MHREGTTISPFCDSPSTRWKRSSTPCEPKSLCGTRIKKHFCTMVQHKPLHQGTWGDCFKSHTDLLDRAGNHLGPMAFKSKNSSCGCLTSGAGSSASASRGRDASGEGAVVSRSAQDFQNGANLLASGKGQKVVGGQSGKRDQLQGTRGRQGGG